MIPWSLSLTRFVDATGRFLNIELTRLAGRNSLGTLSSVELVFEVAEMARLVEFQSIGSDKMQIIRGIRVLGPNNC